jgi:hypothetical protein
LPKAIRRGTAPPAVADVVPARLPRSVRRSVAGSGSEARSIGGVTAPGLECALQLVGRGRTAASRVDVADANDLRVGEATGCARRPGGAAQARGAAALTCRNGLRSADGRAFPEKPVP